MPTYPGYGPVVGRMGARLLRAALFAVALLAGLLVGAQRRAIVPRVGRVGRVDRHSRRAALVLVGAGYRLGPQLGTIHGVRESYHLQAEASDSHVKFAAFVEAAHNVAIDVFVLTYSTPFDNDLKALYGHRLVSFETLPALAGRKALWTAAVRRLSAERTKQYVFVQFLRVDLYLKHAWFDSFKVSDRIRWPSVTWEVGGPSHFYFMRSGERVPRVVDVALYVPRLMISRLQNTLTGAMEHEGYLTLHEHLPHEALGLCIDTLHDSDSQKDWNPLYAIIGRPNALVWATNDGVHVHRHGAFNKSVLGHFPFMNSRVTE